MGPASPVANPSPPAFLHSDLTELDIDKKSRLPVLKEGSD